MFMVIDLMLGGDLRFHLYKLETFSEPMIKMITAEVSCGIVYLHSKNIVHRDLKPDNLLFDSEGHCHLTDFNVAKKFDPAHPMHSTAGSLAYMGTPPTLNG